MPSAAVARRSEVPASAPGVISADSLSKAFRLPHERYSTVRERIVHPFGSRSHSSLEVLRNVSFEVRRGEVFGIVGKNGSGKSSLLKCIAGIYRLDGGNVCVEGRLAPFIELGVGFNHEMTARDNVVMNAVMLGLGRRQARARFDEIIAFAELEEFVDLKLKNYSSGMLVRLALSVTVQVDAEVLLFDEVLAVGDGAFRRKCFDRFQRLRDAGKTIVLVTHDMDTLARVCDRALLLAGGEIAVIGEPATVGDAYDELNRGAGSGLRSAAARPPIPGRRRRSPRGGPMTTRLASPARVRRAWVLAWELAVAQFKLRYLDSALSYCWAVMRPLAYFGVLYLFVTEVAGLSHGIAHYPAYLFTAVMIWTYFEQTTSSGVHCLVQNEPLLRKLPIPHIAIPLSVVLSAFLDLCTNLVAVLAVLLASGITPRPGWLELPLLIAMMSVLGAGVVLVLSALYVRFRDLDQIWIVVSQALFFGTPIFYVATKFSPNVKHLELLNPLAVVFTEMRHALIDSHAPSAAAAAGGSSRLLIPLAVTAVLVGTGIWTFERESPEVAENL